MASIPKPALAGPVVQLYRNVVERLNRDVRKTFEANPPQGAEVGGLLLGTANQQAGSIHVQDFEPLSGEARTDGRFIVTGAEREKLDNTLRQRSGELIVVGCYRSHIGETLTLGVDDVALAQVCLRDTGGLFLLIQPSLEGSLKAGFFFWQDSHIDSAYSVHECSFDTQQLQVAQPPLPSFQQTSFAEPPRLAGLGDHPGGSVPIPRQRSAVEKRHEPANVLPWLGRAFGSRTNAGTWGAKAFGRFAALLSWVRAIRWRKRARVVWDAVIARPLYPLLALSIVAIYMLAYMAWPAFKNFGRPGGSAELELQVDRREGNLRVNWNQNARVVQRAQGAVLTIRDGDSPPVQLQLEPEQLRNGSIVYTPKSASVQFSLEIIAPNGVKNAESVLALASKRSAGSTRSTAALKPSSAGHVRERSNLPRLESGRDFTREKRVPADAQVRSASAPPPAPAKNADPPASNSPAASTGKVGASPLYIPPRALHESRPTLSAGIRAVLTSEVELRIKVKIDGSGRVTEADTLTASGPATHSLVSVTENAARLWKFVPAMWGTEPTPSEAVVVFRFRPSGE